jgi:hypothetical protein
MVAFISRIRGEQGTSPNPYEAGLSTCVETLPRPISMRSHNEPVAKHFLGNMAGFSDT